MNAYKTKHNFLLSGGAGSGKTYSLVEVLKHVSVLYPNAQIACITYTNAAAVEIINRANVDNLTISTIHDFFVGEYFIVS
ncbi:MAG: AAA family ATPase [[Clostridium] scindens]